MIVKVLGDHPRHVNTFEKGASFWFGDTSGQFDFEILLFSISRKATQS
jgi:hypothetical protein